MKSSPNTLLKQLLVAVVVTAACFSFVATAIPLDAAATGGDDEEGNPPFPKPVKKMNKAFKNYLKSVRNMQKLFIASETFRLDDAHAVGAYDLISAFLNTTNRSQLTSSGSNRRMYPRFAGFDDPDTRIGVDNPDTQYMGTIIENNDCQGIWKIFGNRSNTADFILTTFDTSTGQGGGPTLEDEDMVFEPDGSFVAYASCPDVRDLAWDNWLELFASDQIQIARRQSACDWSTEVPGEIHIERVGTDGVPSGPYNPAIEEQQILDGKAIFDVQGPFWPAFIDNIVSQVPVNTATPWIPTGGLGITTQLNMLMWFELAADEALIIRLPDGDPRVTGDIAGYYGLQLASFWGSSQDWANRHVSMSWGLGGECQGELSQPTGHPAQQLILGNGGPLCGLQDAYFIVLSAQDPGVRNWIDTAELSKGIIAGRLQSVPTAAFPNVVGLGSCMLPVAIKVPVFAVQPTLQQLGASFTSYDANDRADQLRERQSYARDKYIFW